MNRVLIFEPHPQLCQLMRERLEAQHLWVCAVSDENAARELFEKQYFHACVWRVKESTDVATLYVLKQQRPSTALVATSARNDTSLVVACMRAGSSNFWADEAELDRFTETVLETLSRCVPEANPLEALELPVPGFIGRHPSILRIFQLIQSIRNTDSIVLITGESGTGKEVVARAIHELSPRKSHPFVAVNCGAIPATLLESELFGHMKGAFTGAIQNRIGRFKMAGSGTLFLDEISDLPIDLQAKILRAIQHRVFEPLGTPQSHTLEARIIAATNQDLDVAVREKRFREDLFYRLNVIPITLPPLRNRKSDIPLLVRHFLERFCRINAKPFQGISQEAMKCLIQYHWPGNIRELENMMERVVVLKRGPGVIEMSDLPVNQFRQVRLGKFVPSFALPEEGVDFNETVNDFENELILQALQRTEGNKNRAAALLNLNRTTLVEKLKRKGLRVGE